MHASVDVLVVLMKISDDAGNDSGVSGDIGTRREGTGCPRMVGEVMDFFRFSFL